MKKLLTFVAAALFLLTSANAKIYYVTTSGNDSNTGESWTKAKRSIEVAITSLQKGDELWIATGSYEAAATIFYTEGIKLYGGFSGTETQVNQRVRGSEPWSFTNSTKVKVAEASVRLFDRADKTAIWTTETLFDGLCVENSISTNSRAGYFKEKVKLQNCIFRGCKATTSIVYMENGGTIVGCLFEDNLQGVAIDGRALPYKNAGQDDPTLFVETLLVENSVLRNNIVVPISYWSTGVVTGQSANSVIIRNTVVANNSREDLSGVNGTTAGILVSNAWTERIALIENCTISGNVLKGWGGTAIMIKTGGASQVNSCRIIDNKNTSDGTITKTGGGVLWLSSGATLTNNVITNNDGGERYLYYGEGGMHFHNTITHNTGNCYFQSDGFLINNIINQDITLDSAKPISMFYFNAVNAAFDYPEDDVVAAIVKPTNWGFKKATSFIGVQTNESQAAELAVADYSLMKESNCATAGDESLISDILSEDVWKSMLLGVDYSGNTRPMTGAVNLGAFQGDLSSVGFETITKDNNHLVVIAIENGIRINSQENGIVMLYTVQGTLIRTQQIMKGDNTVLNLQSGLYLVKMEGTTSAQKVMIK